MKKLGTAPSYRWFCAWLMDQGENRDDWHYVHNAEKLQQYRDVEIHVIIGYPSSFARPNGWEWAIELMRAHNITEKREV